MPQQSKGTKKTKKKKLIPFICITILLIIVVVIIVYLVVKNNKSGKEDTSDENQQKTKPDTAIEQLVLPEESLIDMNNTENAKIENGIKENTSSKLTEEKKFKELTLTNIKLSAEGGVTRLTATAKNNSSQDFQGQSITVVFLNKDGSVYARVRGILPTIKSKESNILNVSTKLDFVNAYDFKIE